MAVLRRFYLRTFVVIHKGKNKRTAANKRANKRKKIIWRNSYLNLNVFLCPLAHLFCAGGHFIR